MSTSKKMDQNRKLNELKKLLYKKEVHLYEKPALGG